MVTNTRDNSRMTDEMVLAVKITVKEDSTKGTGLTTCLMVKASKSMQKESPSMKVSLIADSN